MLSVGVLSLALSPLTPSLPSLAFTGEPAPATLVAFGALVKGDSVESASPALGAATLSDNLVASSTTSSSSSLSKSISSSSSSLFP